MIYLFILIGIILGAVVGNLIPPIPYTYSIYLSVAIIAAIDSIFGAMASIIKNRFDLKVFISGFFGNAILTILLAYLGQKLNVDIYLAAIIVFVGRMFNNLSIIRRHYMDLWYSQYEKHKNKEKKKEVKDKKDIKEAKSKKEKKSKKEVKKA